MKYKTSQLMITMGMDHIDGVSLLPTMLNSLFSVMPAAGRWGWVAGKRWSVKHSNWFILHQVKSHGWESLQRQPKTNF